MWVERRRLVEVWKAARDSGEEVGLATVVRVEGSSYRKPGASLLVTRSGRRTGMVSGGCLEAEVAKKIWWLTEAGSRLQTYTTSFDEDGEAGYGLGCGGRITLLLERGDDAMERVDAIRRSVEQRQASAVVTVIEEHASRQAAVGYRVVLGEQDSRQTETNESSRLREEMFAAGRMALDQRVSTSVQLKFDDERVMVLAEYIAPPPRLFVFGAGDDAQPVAALAGALGWEVIVADRRAQLATRLRFPFAQRVVILKALQQPDSSADAPAFDDRRKLGLSEEDAAVVLTHSYQQDRDILGAVLEARLRYVGVLGPRRRTLQLVEDVWDRLPPGVRASGSATELMERLHSPAGLDLGADGPEAIALSIVAEVQATLEARTGAPLRSLCPALSALSAV